MRAELSAGNAVVVEVVVGDRGEEWFATAAAIAVGAAAVEPMVAFSK